MSEADDIVSFIDSCKYELERMDGMTDIIEGLPNIFKSTSYKSLLLRKLLIYLFPDEDLATKSDEEVFNESLSLGFYMSPEDFSNTEPSNIQSQIQFWNRIFKFIRLQNNDETLKETQDSSATLECDSSEIWESLARIHQESREDSSLGCAELESEEIIVEDHISILKDLDISDLGIKDLINDADNAINYLVPLSKHAKLFVENMEDLISNNSGSTSIYHEGGQSLVQDVTIYKPIDVLHQQLKLFSEISASHNSHLKKIQHPSFENLPVTSIAPSLQDCLKECEKLTDLIQTLP